MKSQNERILERLKTGKALTFIDAEAMGIHRMSARIYNLKEAGHAIKDIYIRYRGVNMKAYWMGVRK